MPVELIIGPPIKGPNSMSRTAAEEALKRNPLFPKEAEYKIEAHAGNWIAAFSTTSKTAAPFGGPPSDEEAPKEEGPPSSDDGPPSDDSGSDGPPSDGGEESPHKDKGGDKGGIHEVNQKLDLLMQALGIDPTAGAGSPVPGMDDGMGGPPGPPQGAPPGLGGPGAPAGPPPPSHPAMAKADKTVHERALKPGEVPPGGTPLGAPAFSSVKGEHPWGHMIGKVPHFRVAEDIGNQNIVEIERELQSLASAGGFKVSNFTPMHGENGERLVTAVISTPTE